MLYSEPELYQPEGSTEKVVSIGISVTFIADRFNDSRLPADSSTIRANHILTKALPCCLK